MVEIELIIKGKVVQVIQWETDRDTAIQWVEWWNETPGKMVARLVE